MVDVAASALVHPRVADQSTRLSGVGSFEPLPVLVDFTAQETGYSLTDDELNRAFLRFKDLADKKKELTSLDLASIVNDEIRDVNIRRYELVGMQVRRSSVEAVLFCGGRSRTSLAGDAAHAHVKRLC